MANYRYEQILMDELTSLNGFSQTVSGQDGKYIYINQIDVYLYEESYASPYVIVDVAHDKTNFDSVSFNLYSKSVASSTTRGISTNILKLSGSGIVLKPNDALRVTLYDTNLGTGNQRASVVIYGAVEDIV